MKEYWKAYGSRARWRDTPSRVFADFVTSCKRPTNKLHNILPISDVNKLELVFFYIYRTLYFLKSDWSPSLVFSFRHYVNVVGCRLNGFIVISKRVSSNYTALTTTYRPFM